MGPEKKLTNKLREWAYATYGKINPKKGTGLLLIKKLTMLAMYGEAGHPDLEVNVKHANTFLIEMKAPGEKSTEKQEYMQECYRALGYHVYVCDNFEEGVKIFKYELGGIR